MTAAHLIDQACLWSAAIVPLPLIIAFRWVGVILGSLAVWGILYYAGIWISSLDPTRHGAMLDMLWLWTGWMAGLLYCVPIFCLREIVAYALRRRARSLGQ